MVRGRMLILDSAQENEAEDRQTLSELMASLKEEINSSEISKLNKKKISKYLDEVARTNIAVQQYKVNHGVHRWKQWGEHAWEDIFRLETALGRRLGRVQEEQDRKSVV